MKKMILGLCVLLLVPSLATAGGDGFSVSALRKQVDATAGDEFRPNLYIPQADALPILKVRLKDIEQTDQGELSGYPSVVQMDYEKYGLAGKTEIGTYPEKTYENLFLPNSEIHLDQVFAANQSASTDWVIRQGALTIQSLDERTKPDVLPQSVTLQSPWTFFSSEGFKENVPCGSLSEVGGYFVSYLPMLHDIPVISGIGAAFEESATASRNLQRVMCEKSQYIYSYYAPDFWSLSGLGIWEEIGIIAQDMQLCSWEKIEQAIRESMNSGNIESFHYAVLGYVIYMDASTDYLNTNDPRYMEYIAVPTWCVSVKYAKKWKDDGWMMIDAQTGKAYDFKSKKLSDWYAPDLIL